MLFNLEEIEKKDYARNTAVSTKVSVRTDIIEVARSIFNTTGVN